VLEDGGKSDFHWGREFWFPPVNVDMRLVDGQTITLGGTTLKVYIHAGHTRGSASYSLTAREGERFYTVMIANIGSINNGVRLTNNAAYPSIADDYARTFERQKALKVDVFLASHAGQYGLHAKYTPGMPYDPNRFVDPEGYRRAVEGAEAGYRRQLAAERGDDRAKIGELRRIDAAATKDGDTDVLMDLLDDEIVALMPGSNPVTGKAGVRKLMEQYAAASAQFQTVSYVQDWRDLRIEGGYAFEWGIFTSVVRNRENGKTTESTNKVMRVLKRQPDGFWKVFRTTMN
jgi:ketosteroid isomerase-like protein